MRQILLAEDDAVTRLVVAAQLQKLGYQTLLAKDGEEGWRMFQKDRPAIVVTDWMMPNADGTELCRRIRELADARYTYVILLTALDRAAGYVEGMKAGADDFVSKPCSLEDLNVRLRVAERILALQSEARQLEELLPICPTCRKIRSEGGEWQHVEMYIMKRTDAQFSHGICPECFEKYMRPQLERYAASKGNGSNGRSASATG